jgi:hypothetical protein
LASIATLEESFPENIKPGLMAGLERLWFEVAKSWA